MIEVPPEPTDLKSLFGFYQTYVKYLYSEVSANGCLPQETLFEIHAALDHISRKWVHGETEEHVVKKAFSHFKRSCLDIFKIKAKAATDQWAEINQTQIHLIDNGEFKQRALKLYTEIKNGALEARRMEGDCGTDDLEVRSFTLWTPVYRNCLTFEKEFYNTEKIEWARQIEKSDTDRIMAEAKKLVAKERWWGRLMWGVVIGVLANFAFTFLLKYFSYI